MFRLFPLYEVNDKSKFHSLRVSRMGVPVNDMYSKMLYGETPSDIKYCESVRVNNGRCRRTGKVQQSRGQNETLSPFNTN